MHLQTNLFVACFTLAIKPKLVSDIAKYSCSQKKFKISNGFCFVLLRSLPPQSGTGSGHLVWLVSSCALGAAVPVLCIKGGSPFLRLLFMNIGMAAGVSIVGMRSPNDKFLRVAGPVGGGYGSRRNSYCTTR